MSMKPKWDITINIPAIIMVLGAILVFGAQQAQQAATVETVRDHEARIRNVEGFNTRLATMESQIGYTAEAVKRIDARMEARTR